MAKGYPELILTINPIGMEKIELFAVEDDPDSETMGVEMYQQLAVEIHKFGKRTKEILCAHWDEVRQQERNGK